MHNTNSASVQRQNQRLMRMKILLPATLLLMLSSTGCRRAGRADNTPSTDDAVSSDTSPDNPFATPRRTITALPTIATGTQNADVVVWPSRGSDTLFYQQPDIESVTLYRTDGTVPGTGLLATFHRDGYAVSLNRVGMAPDGNVNFEVTFTSRSEDDLRAVEKWQSNGTPDGTLPADWTSPSQPAPQCPFTGENVDCYRIADVGPFHYWLYNPGREDDDNSACTLWRTHDADPTATQISRSDGTAIIIDRYFPSNHRLPHLVDGEYLYFQMQDETDEPFTELHRVHTSSAQTETLLSMAATEMDACRSWASQLTKINHQIVFTWCENIHGGELWQTDGTADGTGLLMDVKPGATSSALDSFTVSGDVMYFVYRNPGDGADDQMWRTDGTPSGTFMVADIGSEGEITDMAEHSAPVSYQIQTAANNIIYWRMPVGGPSGGIWKSDGTVAGTYSLIPDIGYRVETFLMDAPFIYIVWYDNEQGEQLAAIDVTDESIHPLLDVRPGAAGTESYCCVDEIGVIEEFRAIGNGRVLFLADDGFHGLELWSTDGAPAGTFPLGDFNPHRASGFLNGLAGDDDVYFFNANDQIHGRELWMANLQGATVQRLSDFPAGLGFNDILAVTPLAERTIVTRRSSPSLWHPVFRTLSRPYGNTPMEPLAPLTERQLQRDIAVTDDGTGYFLVQDDADGAPYRDCTVWKTTGLDATTVPVTRANCSGYPLLEEPLYALGNRVLFVGPNNPDEPDDSDDVDDVGEVWVTDDTAGDTQLFSADLERMYPVGTIGRRHFFIADDRRTSARDEVLYVTEGTAESTMPVPGLPEHEGRSDNSPPKIWQNHLWVAIQPPESGVQLWKINGDTLAVSQVTQLPDTRRLFIELATDQYLYVAAHLTPDSGEELWRLSPEAPTATALPEIYPGPGSASPEGITAAGDYAYFWANTDQFGASPDARSLIAIDPDGRMQLISHHVTPRETTSSAPSHFTIGCHIYFVGQETDASDNTPDALWELDGCARTLAKLSSDPPAALHDIQLLHQFDDRILFSAEDGENGRELYLIQSVD